MGFIEFITGLKKKPEIKKPLKTIKDLEIFDDVWVKENEEIYRGWVFDITRRNIVVCYGSQPLDFRFQIPRPLTLTEVKQDNKILYCNEPENNN